MTQPSNIVKASGRVGLPPSHDDVLALIADAMIRKRTLTLTPGEVRVLHDWLVLLEQANPERLIRSAN